MIQYIANYNACIDVGAQMRFRCTTMIAIGEELEIWIASLILLSDSRSIVLLTWNEMREWLL